MKWPLLGLCVIMGAAALAASGVKAAEPLTCDVFRDRLNGGLVLLSAADAEAPVYRETSANPDGSKRLSWRTPSLEGTLTCGSGASFRDFYVALTVASKERFVDQLKRFVAINGAAICATSDALPIACEDVGKQLLQNGLAQMGTAYKQRVSAPNGIASRTLQPQLKTGITVAPTLLTFSLSVDDGSTVGANRQPLPPPPAAAP